MEKEVTLSKEANETLKNAGILLRIILGVFLAVLAYRGVTLCEMEGKLDIPHYPVVTVAVCAVGTGCAMAGYIKFIHMIEERPDRGSVFLQNLMALLAFLYIAATAVPVFYASLDSMLPDRIFRSAQSYSGEITAVSEPEKYQQVVPFFPEVTRFDCEYKYHGGTETYTGRFNTAVEYSVGDEISVCVPGSRFIDEYVLESERSFSDDESYQIGALTAIYIVMVIFLVPYGSTRGLDKYGTA